MSRKNTKRTVKPLKWQICTEGVTEANYLNWYIKEKCNKERSLRKLPPLHDDDYKADESLCEYFGGVEGVCKARENAKKRFKSETYPHSSVKCSQNAPCTNIFVLLDELDKFANRVHSLL